MSKITVTPLGAGMSLPFVNIKYLNLTFQAKVKKFYSSPNSQNIVLGQDVGRSCLLVSMGGKRIMLDCGMHMGFNDERRFPDFSFVCGDEPGASLTSSLDCVIISHFHLGLSNYLIFDFICTSNSRSELFIIYFSKNGQIPASIIFVEHLLCLYSPEFDYSVLKTITIF